MSDDTLQFPFSVDYLTKYRVSAGEADFQNESELDEVSLNTTRHGEQESELFPEIDARYDHTEGALAKEFDDWQLAVDTSHPRSPDGSVGDIDPPSEIDEPDSDDKPAPEPTPENSHNYVPDTQFESRGPSAPDASEVLATVGDYGNQEMGEVNNNNTKNDNNENENHGAIDDDGTGDATMEGGNGNNDVSNVDNGDDMEEDRNNNDEREKGNGGDGGDDEDDDDDDDDDEDDDEDDDDEEEEEDEEREDEIKPADGRANETASDEEMEQGAEESKEEEGIQPKAPTTEPEPQAEGEAPKGSRNNPIADTGGDVGGMGPAGDTTVIFTAFCRLSREADNGPGRVLAILLATLQKIHPKMMVVPFLAGPHISNPADFPTNESISKYFTETRTSQKARYEHPTTPSKLSGLLRLKSPVPFSDVTLPPEFALNNEFHLETLGEARKLGVFLNTDRRMHRVTATQDLERQFKDAQGHSIHFKLSWETVFSEPRRQGDAGKYVVISVSKNDLTDARSFFAKEFGNKLHDVAGRTVIYVPFAGSKPTQWLKFHECQLDWQTNSIAKHFRDLPIDTVIGNTTTRKALQSCKAPGGSNCRIFTAVERCRNGGTLLLYHGGQHTNAMSVVMDLQSHLERVTGGILPQHLMDKVTRKTPGMGDSTVASDSDSESLFSFITTSLDSRTQQAATAPKPNAWDKPMNDISIAPTYKFTSFSDPHQSSIPQTPTATPTVSDDETASLHSTIAKLKIDNATSETKQKDLQDQLTILQVTVSSLTTASSLTSSDPQLAQLLTQVNQHSSFMSQMKSILEKNPDLPELAELSALIKSFPPSAGSQV